MSITWSPQAKWPIRGVVTHSKGKCPINVIKKLARVVKMGQDGHLVVRGKTITQ